MIKTKSVYDKRARSDGVRILVTKYHPRIKGFKKGIAYKYWLRTLAPSGYTLGAWQARHVNGFTESDFKTRYWDTVYDAMWYNNSDWKIIEGLLKEGKTITLLCYEREGEFCHRHILKEFLERRLEVIKHMPKRLFEEVRKEYAKGKSVMQIAVGLDISQVTVKRYIKQIEYAKGKS